MKNPSNRLAVLALFFAACVGSEDVSERRAEIGGPPVVTTSAASYSTGQAISVSWVGLPGNANDWIAIAPVGSDAMSVSQWVYSGGQTSGTHVFGGMPNGSYVARAFLDDGYELLDESPAFDVAGGATGNIATNAANYSFDDTVVVTWSALPGNQNDWIAIAPQGSPATTVTRWVYTAGAAAGSTGFESPTTGGTYVARAFLDDSYTMVGESAAFAVGLTVSTNKSSYTTAEGIIVSWENLPTNNFDWVAIAPAGSPLTTVTTWVYTNGQSTGQNTFSALGAGSYVARAFLDNTYTLLDETAAFTVGTGGGVTVTSSAATYAVGEDIVVTWTGLPGNANDWIAIAPDASADTSVIIWVYTGGQADGSTTFAGGLGAAGSYVARAFEDDSYSKLGETAAFTVQ